MSTKKTGPASRKGSKAKASGSKEKLLGLARAAIAARIGGKKQEHEVPTAKDVANNADVEAAVEAAKANAPKATKEAKPKRMSALDAAAKVLGGIGGAMSAKNLIAEMETSGLWKSPGGKTPDATLHAAMCREIRLKGAESRFAKSGRGLFMSNRKGA